jgi:hypothetical protein
MSTPKLDYISIGKTIDGTNYCSGVETLAENIVEDNESDAVITFPLLNEWATLRSDAYRMTSDNIQMTLPTNIYKIKSVKLNLKSIDLNISDGFGSVYNFVDANGNTIGNELDITSFVFTAKEWQALGRPVITDEKAHDYVSGYFQDNTLYWEEGSNKIPLLGTVYKIGSSLMGGIFADNTPTYNRLLRSVLYKLGELYTYLGTTLKNAMKSASALFMNDAWWWEYRVEYIPISSKTKIRARKEEKQEVEYLQPFNQRAEINAASAFGKNMWLTAQKTGTQQIAVVKNYTKLKDIPPVGALVNHNGKKYRLIANSYTITNTIYIQVTHTLSENWTSKSKHVSVNQKYRNYNIPQDILWRNMYWEDYITVSGTKMTSDENGGVDIAQVLRLFNVDSRTDKTIDSLCWMFTDSKKSHTYKKENEPTWTYILEEGVVLPCNTYSAGHSFVISASFKDNLSAGLRHAISSADAIRESNLCEETLYCADDGTLENINIILADKYESLSDNEDLISNATEYGKAFYPSILEVGIYNTATNNRLAKVDVNKAKTPIFEKNFYVDKDPGEAIKFTYQVHFVTEDDCVVGNTIAEHNPIIKRYEPNANARKFKVWLLKDHIRDGSDLLEVTENATVFEHTKNRAYFDISTSNTNNTYGTIYLNNALQYELRNGGYKAWAITDENNNLYVGRNENQEGVVYFCISHKRP